MKYKSKKMGPFQSYLNFWRKYASFKGVSSRSAYWWPFLWNWLIRLILAIVALVGFLNNGTHDFEFEVGISCLVIYCLAALIPSLSLNFRRYQDTGISGWWIVLTYGLPIILRLILVHYPSQSLINSFCGGLIFIFSVIIIVLPIMPSKVKNKYDRN